MDDEGNALRDPGVARLEARLDELEHSILECLNNWLGPVNVTATTVEEMRRDQVDRQEANGAELRGSRQELRPSEGRATAGELERARGEGAAALYFQAKALAARRKQQRRRGRRRGRRRSR